MIVNIIIARQCHYVTLYGHIYCEIMTIIVEWHQMSTTSNICNHHHNIVIIMVVSTQPIQLFHHNNGTEQHNIVGEEGTRRWCWSQAYNIVHNDIIVNNITVIPYSSSKQ